MGNFFRQGVAGACVAAAVLPLHPAAAGTAGEAEDRVVHRTIVHYVAIRTFLPEKLCASASAPVRAEVAAVVQRFRARFPELVRLAESSPLFDEANRPNLQTVREYETRTPQEHDETCAQLRNEIAVDLNGEQVYFDQWTRELRRQLRRP
ncbi:MAG TPA: hypothetical protein VEC01_09595 [Noviherbaspirillum sp.]|uniref:hypothetical protein n=1 Tax=Noviherbaspirillum sp. TaxID=1926288 RepID=UPI002D652578|nr:hypothetical protein [Noviherbaspirillum sp.]HYD95564.1 hypothetical protein [Noviherbaspirillum sp.]